MAEEQTNSLKGLIEELCRLPGIGARSAERIALHLLETPKERALNLAQAIGKLKTSMRHCRVCFNLCESELCSICSDDSRDRSVICVVELPKDVMRIEATGAYKGLYHVLGGHIAPLDGIGPDELGISSLEARLQGGEIGELIIATNPTVEGDATAHYLADLATKYKIQASRIAHGVPLGGELEYVDGGTLSHAFFGRRALDQ